MKIDVTTLDAKKAGQIDLDETIFGLEPRADILHRVVTWQLAKRRSGSHKAKERNEINGTSKKMHRQKGTGGARHGNKKAPIFRGGGKAHGPRVRSHEFDLPKKVRRLGLKHALSAKVGAKELIVLDAATASEPKTKALAAQFGKLGLDNALIVDGAAVDDNFRLAARNLPNIDVLPLQGLNVYDILRRRHLVLTKSAVDGLMARFDENASQGAKA